jgi:hypothetical protein
VQTFSINPTEMTFDVKVGGHIRKLYFNINAFRMFEKHSSILPNGKRLRFHRFFAKLMMAMGKAQEEKLKIEAAKSRGENLEDGASFDLLLDMLDDVGADDFFALVYGALHVYDSENNPSWPISPGQLGRLLTPLEIVNIWKTVQSGMNGNVPLPDDSADKGGEEPVRPTIQTPPPTTTESDGGSISGELDDELSSLLTTKSAG